MIDLAGVDQLVVFAPAEINAIPLAFVLGKAGDRQRLPLDARLLHPVAAAVGNEGAAGDRGLNAFVADCTALR
jgi:hypothetical protein